MLGVVCALPAVRAKAALGRLDRSLDTVGPLGACRFHRRGVPLVLPATVVLLRTRRWFILALRLRALFVFQEVDGTLCSRTTVLGPGVHVAQRYVKIAQITLRT